MRKLVMSSMVASAIMVSATAKPVFAETAIYFNVAPPTVRHEVVPAPRAGYVWAPGYWDYNGRRHVWKTGHWVRSRPGYVYYAPTWQQSNGRYYLQRERWVESSRVARGPNNPYGDRDRDGVPNRYDRDRDNDGVPNYRDSQPDNPRRR